MSDAILEAVAKLDRAADELTRLYGEVAALSAKLAEAERERGKWEHQCGVNLEHYNSEKAMRRRLRTRVSVLEKALKLAEPHVLAAATDRISGAQRSFDAVRAALSATKEPKPTPATQVTNEAELAEQIDALGGHHD